MRCYVLELANIQSKVDDFEQAKAGGYESINEYFSKPENAREKNDFAAMFQANLPFLWLAGGLLFLSLGVAAYWFWLTLWKIRLLTLPDHRKPDGQHAQHP